MKASIAVPICILCSIVALAGGAVAQANDDQKREVERRLIPWDAAAEARYSLPACISPSSVTLEGRWSAQRGLDGSSLEFEARRDGTFGVTFATGGCLGGWDLQRTAKLEGVTVQLDRPVEEYLPSTFSRLHAVLLGTEVVLVPSTALAEVRAAFKAGSCSGFQRAFHSLFVFRRPQHEKNAAGRPTTR